MGVFLFQKNFLVFLKKILVVFHFVSQLISEGQKSPMQIDN